MLLGLYPLRADRLATGELGQPARILVFLIVEILLVDLEEPVKRTTDPVARKE